jgi:hypothetical protein
MKIIAIDKDGEEREIDDLYWFKEQMVHSFAEGNMFDYKFRFVVEPGDNVEYEVMIGRPIPLLGDLRMTVEGESE